MEEVAHDPLLAHKAPYLNMPFWIIRMVVYFSLWILMFYLIRRMSLREDRTGGLEPFRKLEHLAKVYIFIVIITFSFAMFDWIMSIDAHWYSTIFAVKNFVAAFHHAAIVITFIAFIWFLPFVLLMPKATSRNRTVLKIVIPFLIVGQFIDLYIQIFPGTVGDQVLGFQEIGTFIGFAGLFMLVTAYVMRRANLYPSAHPFLEESRHHHI